MGYHLQVIISVIFFFFFNIIYAYMYMYTLLFSFFYTITFVAFIGGCVSYSDAVTWQEVSESDPLGTDHDGYRLQVIYKKRITPVRLFIGARCLSWSTL